jgi:hypothetical protein
MFPEAALPRLRHPLALADLLKALLHRIPERLLDDAKVRNPFDDPLDERVQP